MDTGFYDQISSNDYPLYADPFALSDAGADQLEVSRTGLARVAIVAAAVGARFERERIMCDAAAWMMAPRRMFDGSCAIEACLHAGGFERAVVLNAPGGGFGLDADPAPGSSWSNSSWFERTRSSSERGTSLRTTRTSCGRSHIWDALQRRRAGFILYTRA